jgi:thioredoxin reductase (NADPH)
MADRARANPKIKWLLDSVIVEVLGKSEGFKKVVTGVMVKNTKTGAVSEAATDSIFMAIGHEPNTKLFRGALDMDDVGYIRTVGSTSQTSVAGVFAAGDCQDHVYRQAITAAGTGCMAAIDAERFIDANPVEFAAKP